ncbi:MAG TPA: RDD family protein [Terriglobia bacterium]|nr:RDD family protein [Terriglobia bacterium]
MRTNRLSVETPEGIVFSQTLAGPAMRCAAWFVDLMCILTLRMVVANLLSWLDWLSSSVGTAAQILMFFVISVGYAIFLEWAWRGQTIGKRLFGLRVLDAEGLRLKFDQIVTRNLLRFVDILPVCYLVGGVSCWLSGKLQRLGDIAANTVVVRIPVLAQPDLDQLLSGKFNSLRQYPHLAARLRQQVEPAEAAAALQALIRRDEFEPKSRVELFEYLAAYFREKVAFPQEATDGVGDEQYIRNVVDVLYRTANQPAR